MKLQRRRPFRRWLNVAVGYPPANLAADAAHTVIGLDPGHDSMQAAVLFDFWPTGHIHAWACKQTRHAPAVDCIRPPARLARGSSLTVATEAAANAVPPGHGCSLRELLEEAGHSVWLYRGSRAGRLSTLEASLSKQDPRFELTIDPELHEIIEALFIYENKRDERGRVRHATRGPAHFIDALSYGVAYVVSTYPATAEPRSVASA